MLSEQVYEEIIKKLMGADGGIGSIYNIMAEKFVAVYDLFKSGKIDAARAKQYEINRIVRVLLEYGTGGALKNTKAALEIMGFEMGCCAYPTSEMDKAEKVGLKKALEAVGIYFKILFIIKTVLLKRPLKVRQKTNDWKVKSFGHAVF